MYGSIGQFFGDEARLNLTLFLLIGSSMDEIVEETRTTTSGEIRTIVRTQAAGAGVLTIDSIDIELS